jgi:hypothetical protein
MILSTSTGWRETERGCWPASRQEPIFWPIRDTFGERPVFARSGRLESTFSGHCGRSGESDIAHGNEIEGMSEVGVTRGAVACRGRIDPMVHLPEEWQAKSLYQRLLRCFVVALGLRVLTQPGSTELTKTSVPRSSSANIFVMPLMPTAARRKPGAPPPMSES